MVPVKKCFFTYHNSMYCEMNSGSQVIIATLVGEPLITPCLLFTVQPLQSYEQPDISQSSEYTEISRRTHSQVVLILL